MSESALVMRPTALSVWRDYFELSKARIVLMVILTTLAGFLMASPGPVDAVLLINTLIGTALVAAGTNALNQYVERDLDGMMNRTRLRPLPAGRITPHAALLFSVTISVVGTLYLAVLVNLLAAFLAFFTLASYLFVYTPMKRVSSHSTAVGAVPGAIPPMIGWAAVTGGLQLGAWIAFAILFLWQLPHFLAIGWMYREDYGRAGFAILSVKDRDGKASGRQALWYSAALLAVSVVPSFVGMAGTAYFVGAVASGGLFVASAVLFARGRTMRNARYLFGVSILYLPLIMSLLVAGSRG